MSEITSITVVVPVTNLTDEIATLRAQLAAAEARANECGSGAGCLYKDALIAAAEARAERHRAALKYIIDDLEVRSQWKSGDQKGVVDIGHGAYMQGKAALAEGDAG